jgi:hypothetical protein
MNAKSIKDIAEYIITDCKINHGIPESVSDAMNVSFWSFDFINDVRLDFGAHKGSGLWEVDKSYLTWIAEQVELFLKTHSVRGVSLK